MTMQIDGRANGSPDDVSAQIEALQEMSVHDLRSLWEKVFGYQAPATAKSTFLRRAIAWKIQVKAHGGVKPETHKLLLRIAKDPSLAKSPKVSDAVPEIKPGTRLLRSWDGKTHEVIVTPQGYLWRGKTWKSLSRIAREITGTSWSGPTFFGLKPGKKGRSNIVGGGNGQ
jgi:hypothetical protein